MMKYTADRPYIDPDKAARRLMEHGRAFKPVQDGRIYIEKINALFCCSFIGAHEIGIFLRWRLFQQPISIPPLPPPNYCRTLADVRKIE
jgi:hypothetical protein